ncbi:hypothetical protein PVL29_019379 [Vitis rotundifolia]|uniref:Uncharacterized protein n=1 Tax=Vitis rotundifolia TaxID=103349 RepID=A0AA39DFA8_VITRO|nr:hypothetical protein PVL29_019379 [Vitis rotundifolia]
MELVVLSFELVCGVQVAELASWYRFPRAAAFCSNLACCSNCLSIPSNDTSVAGKVALCFTSGIFETPFSASFVKEARGLGVIIAFSKMRGWMGVGESASNFVSGFQNSNLSPLRKPSRSSQTAASSNSLKLAADLLQQPPLFPL